MASGYIGGRFRDCPVKLWVSIGDELEVFDNVFRVSTCADRQWIRLCLYNDRQRVRSFLALVGICHSLTELTSGFVQSFLA